MPSGADLRQLAQEARRKSVPPATPGALPCEPSARICPPAQRCGAQPDVETLLVAYELGGWIEALGLDTLAGPSIVIDEDQNADRLDAFEEAVKRSAELYDDDDGELDPDDDLIAH